MEDRLDNGSEWGKVRLEGNIPGNLVLMGVQRGWEGGRQRRSLGGLLASLGRWGVAVERLLGSSEQPATVP